MIGSGRTSACGLTRRRSGSAGREFTLLPRFQPSLVLAAGASSSAPAALASHVKAGLFSCILVPFPLVFAGTVVASLGRAVGWGTTTL